MQRLCNIQGETEVTTLETALFLISVHLHLSSVYFFQRNLEEIVIKLSATGDFYKIFQNALSTEMQNVK